MSAPAPDDVIRAERLLVRYRRATACEGIDFSVSPGEIFVLLGRAKSGRTTILRAAAGEIRPTEGALTVLGLDAWKGRRRLRRKIRPVEDASELARALAGSSETRLLLADDLRIPDPEAGGGAIRESLRRAPEPRPAILAATDDPGTAEAVGDRVAILRAGRLVATARTPDLLGGFRRIRYRNERTPTREDYGTELDDFDAVRVRVRGWGIEAVVSNATDALVEKLRGLDGVVDVESSAMTLAEIFDVVAPPPSPSVS